MLAVASTTPPPLMSLPVACRWAKQGFAIRRVIWDGATGHPELAWLIYRGGLYLRLCAGTDPWVLQNDEITRADFLACDWTTLPPASMPATSSPGEAIPGYPDWDDEPAPLAGLDVTNPNAGGGSGSGGDGSGGGSDGGSGGGFGGGGSGGGGGGGGRPRRKPRSRNDLPSITLQAQLLDTSCIPRLPEAPCGHLNLPNYELQSRQIVGTLSLGAVSSGKDYHAQVTVWCGGQNLLRNWGGPGDSFDFGPATFRQRTGYAIPVFATVRVGNQTVTRTEQVNWPDLCPPQGPCPPPPPPPDPSGPPY